MTDSELDRQVAERVMGWKCPCNGERESLPYELQCAHLPPPYTTNPAAMMQVIERMRKQFGFEGYNRFLLSNDGNEWYCEFPKPKWESASAPSLCRAVCLAALRAVEPPSEPRR